jgi:hypothetical protein
VPLPVALGGNDYAFVPPAAPSSSTDRLVSAYLLKTQSFEIKGNLEVLLLSGVPPSEPMSIDFLATSTPIAASVTPRLCIIRVQ